MASLPAPPHAAVLELGQRRLVPLVVHGLVAHDELLRGEMFCCFHFSDMKGIPLVTFPIKGRERGVCTQCSDYRVTKKNGKNLLLTSFQLF